MSQKAALLTHSSSPMQTRGACCKSTSCGATRTPAINRIRLRAAAEALGPGVADCRDRAIALELALADRRDVIQRRQQAPQAAGTLARIPQRPTLPKEMRQAPPARWQARHPPRRVPGSSTPSLGDRSRPTRQRGNGGQTMWIGNENQPRQEVRRARAGQIVSEFRDGRAEAGLAAASTRWSTTALPEARCLRSHVAFVDCNAMCLSYGGAGQPARRRDSGWHTLRTRIVTRP